MRGSVQLLWRISLLGGAFEQERAGKKRGGEGGKRFSRGLGHI